MNSNRINFRAIAFTLIINAVMVSVQSASQTPAAPADVSNDTKYYSVSYIEVNPSSHALALAALQRYRDVSHKHLDHTRTEIFEQADRSGHFVIVETWKTQAAFDANGDVRMQLIDTIQPLRFSDWDTRPYKSLSVPPTAVEADDKVVVVITHVDLSPDPSVGLMFKTLAEASRREEGNVRFDVLLHTMRGNHIQIVEMWKNQKALDAHAAAAHTRKYRDDLQRFLGSPLDERIFKSVR